MRFRSRSVRARIIALLLIPLASLTGLWAYTTATSVSQVSGLIQVSTDYLWFGTSADDLARSLQDERRAAVTYAASPAGRGDLKALHAAEAATDRTAAVVRAHAADAGRLSDLNAAQRTAVRNVVAQISRLPSLRAEAADPRLTWNNTYQDYTDAQTPFFDLRVQLSDLQAGDLTREAGNLIELARAREYISREDALMYGARAAGGFTQTDFQAFLVSSKGEQLLFQTHEAQLPAQEAALYEDFTDSPVYSNLGSLETAVGTLGQNFAAQRIDGAKWQSTLNETLSQLSTINSQAVTLAGGRARSYAMDVIWRDVWVGVAGLVAVLFSVLMSLRIGRRLVRELTGLRDSAFDLAGVRLPDVMRRLRDGERVDLAVEVPQVPVGTGDRDEIAQVGRAFNAVQRSAVEAAVEQAELRRGIAAVFVNLARRSQALLHRQLTLLDEMERRADDPDELEDLFRLDHLTTRMRRHAEGLIILSGSAPGRNWRRPVRILDVVRAAVGEVEDYARVRVHRMPPIAVVGGAVSDVVHLVAELVENAAVFSPPHTQVRIQGEEVANGFVLEIDDRGLGMGEEAMAAANTRLATGGDFDLADTDRLGLFVISRLSARHGVRVSLRRSPYGGVTAVVLLPPELLAAVAARPGDATGAEDTSEQSLPPVRQRVGRELPKGAGDAGRMPERYPGPRHAAPVPAAAADPDADSDPDGDADGQGVAALPRRRPPALTSRADSYLAAREGGARDGGSGFGSGSAPGSGSGSGEQTRELAIRQNPATAKPSAVPQGPEPVPLLPRRVRQANLAPQLRVAAETAEGLGEHPSSEEPAPRERSPEEVRATFASFQRGLSRGRAAPVDAPEPVAADAAPAVRPVPRAAGATDPPVKGLIR